MSGDFLRECVIPSLRGGGIEREDDCTREYYESLVTSTAHEVHTTQIGEYRDGQRMK